MASDLDSQVTEIIELLEPSVVFFAGLDSRSTHLQTRLPVSGQNGFGDQREEVGFREKVPLVPVVGKAAEIERAVLPTIYGFRVGNRAVAYSALYHNSFILGHSCSRNVAWDICRRWESYIRARGQTNPIHPGPIRTDLVE